MKKILSLFLSPSILHVLQSSSQTIDLQGFTNGIYLVQLKNTEGVIARKIVIEKQKTLQ
jgi:hypothetical protein